MGASEADREIEDSPPGADTGLVVWAWEFRLRPELWVWALALVPTSPAKYPLAIH